MWIPSDKKIGARRSKESFDRSKWIKDVEHGKDVYIPSAISPDFVPFHH
jgi:hypothetical protein